MQRRKRWALGALLVVAVGLIVPAVVAAGPDGGATVQFGNPNAGSPFPPPEFEGHDSSSNARDNVIPRTSVISAGGNVTFNVAPGHQVAVYEAGTTPEDITVPPFPVPFNLFINDANNRLALGGLVPGAWMPPADTFNEPGRYLILCNFTPHFGFFNMYGWVTVK